LSDFPAAYEVRHHPFFASGCIAGRHHLKDNGSSRCHVPGTKHEVHPVNIESYRSSINVHTNLVSYVTIGKDGR